MENILNVHYLTFSCRLSKSLPGSNEKEFEKNLNVNWKMILNFSECNVLVMRAGHQSSVGGNDDVLSNFQSHLFARESDQNESARAEWRSPKEVSL